MCRCAALTNQGMVSLLKDRLLRLVALPEGVKGDVDLRLLLLGKLPQALNIDLLVLQHG